MWGEQLTKYQAAMLSYKSCFGKPPSPKVFVFAPWDTCEIVTAACKFGACGLDQPTSDIVAIGLWKQVCKSGQNEMFQVSMVISEVLAKGKVTCELRRRIVEFLPIFSRAMQDRGVPVGELPTPQQIVDWLVECGGEV